MKLIRLFFALALLSTITPSFAAQTGGVIATPHPIATEAGKQVYARGGNAVDAAVAAALTLGVVDGYNSGIGGGCLMLVRWSSGEIAAFDGRETAPALATSDMFIREGQVDSKLSRLGALAVGVPGSLAVYDHALRVGGRFSLAELLAGAAYLAEEGFEIDGNYSERLARAAPYLLNFKSSSEVFLDERGFAWPEGHRLRQPDLARTYRSLSRQGIDYFYGGPFAEAVEDWMNQNGGLLSTQDFRDYQMRFREPVACIYRGYTVVGFPPPSSGGIQVAEILNILENFDLKALDQESRSLRWHVMGEAMKRAFADRAYWLGDSDYVSVPRGLAGKSYARALAGQINLDKTSPVSTHGMPPKAAEDLFGKHTAHISAADAQGNWVALTASLNTSFGSKVVIPGTGVLLNNQMDDFSALPDSANAYGLVGFEANSVGPRKRPLSSMSPTLVLEGQRPVLVLGAAGGPTIISQVVQVIVNYLDLGMPLEEAVAAPRIHHQWKPDRLRTEESVQHDQVRELLSYGHLLEMTEFMGATQAVGYDAGGALVAVEDPRLNSRRSSH
ncbi:MAG: gamma-glutamyltransferase [Candidatus Omnitrophica bacterium]|nr:gamma-glutamyltransferase [Candidatus Omnitrophota bacterium]